MASDKSCWDETWAVCVLRPGSFFFLEIRQPSVLNPDCKTSSADCLLHCTGSRPSLPSSLRHAHCTHTEVLILFHWMTPMVAPQTPAQLCVVSTYIPTVKNTFPLNYVVIIIMAKQGMESLKCPGHWRFNSELLFRHVCSGK